VTHNPRALWRPKLPEREGGPCAGCPFTPGNDEKFGKVVTQLRTKAGITEPASRGDIAMARALLARDLKYTGDFACHGSAYGPGMEVRPVSEHRQCPGASAKFREGSSYQQEETHGKKGRSRKGP
jgi:hypothetical protein